MKTKPKDRFPAIEWEVTNDLLSSDIDEREETYTAIGTDARGLTYTGTAVYSCGELIRIDDVEPYIQDKKLRELADFMAEQQNKLEAMISDGPDEHSPEMYFGDADKL